MNDPASAEDLPTFTSSYLVIDDFLPMELALSMRADIDRHFGEPAAHQPHTHQVWNYWYVPGTYTYLRTQPERLMGDDKVKTFMATLREYTAARLGMSFVMPPILSLYVDGCNQQFHNDATNGRFAFVYSLTNPVRQTIGGATILMHEGDLFRGHLASPMAIRGFCDLIEPRFNRLLIFDDRVFHAVERVEGSMDPVEGRFVLHGHIRDEGPLLGGALSHAQVQPALQDVLNRFTAQHGEDAYNYHGPISVRFLIEPRGTVSGLQVLMDRVTYVAERHAEGWPMLRAKYLAAISTARFPEADGRTSVILPMIFSGPSGR
ncbi:MAG TPA: hypothetical protein VFB13_03855 [Reyranella sp.]|nr:hypothetical protein [Reyranella sp.]